MGGRVLATCAIAAVLVAGCGDEDFERKPRSPVRVELTGVIQTDRVTVSPARDLGAGPFEITISNQTDEPHTITLEGETVKDDAGSLDPNDTLSIRRTLDPGTYEVRAGSEEAQPKEIEPAVLEIGAERNDSNSDLLLP
jgi:predicted component of type VI protein secretion system